MNRAEQGGGTAADNKENLPGVEDLKSGRLELEEKIRQTEKERKENLGKRIGDREELIGEAKETDNLLTEVQKTIDQYSQADEKDLLDDQSKKEFEKYKQLQQKLEEQLAQINKKIDQLSAQPDVLDTLHGEAHKENAEKTKKKIIEQAVDKFKPEVEALLKEMEKFTSQVSQMREEREGTLSQRIGAFRQFKEKQKLEQLLKDLHIYNNPQTFEDIRVALEKAKAKLSPLSYFKKKAIDNLLESQDFIEGSAIEQRFESADKKYNELWYKGNNAEKNLEVYFQRLQQIKQDAENFGLELAQSSDYPELATDKNINEIQSNIRYKLDEIRRHTTETIKSGLDENKLYFFISAMEGRYATKK